MLKRVVLVQTRQTARASFKRICRATALIANLCNAFVLPEIRILSLVCKIYDDFNFFEPFIKTRPSEIHLRAVIMFKHQPTRQIATSSRVSHLRINFPTRLFFLVNEETNRKLGFSLKL